MTSLEELEALLAKSSLDALKSALRTRFPDGLQRHAEQRLLEHGRAHSARSKMAV